MSGRRGVLLGAAALAALPRAGRAAEEELIWIPAEIGGERYRLLATLYRPAPAGRFPLVVMNHGTSPNPAGNARRARFSAAAAAFVRLGFAVVAPMRRGYGGSEGAQVRIRGDLTAYGLENARDIQAAVRFLQTQTYVDPERMVVLGQSTGGLATMAYLSMADRGVRGGLNFHGGVRPRNLVADPLLESRVTAFAAFARTTALPSLWFYTANDHSSRPAFIARLYAAYQAAGGKAELVQLGDFMEDGHTLVDRAEGVPLWLPHVSAFLGRMGLG